MVCIRTCTVDKGVWSRHEPVTRDDFPLDQLAAMIAVLLKVKARLMRKSSKAATTPRLVVTSAGIATMAKMPKSITGQLHLRLLEKDQAALRRLAADRDQTLSATVRFLLYRYLRAQQ
jgi:hypothetical protein